MNALLEHAAQARLALDEQHVRTVFVRGDGGRKPAGAAADDDDVVHHACTSPDFVGPNVMGASAEDLRTALSGTPRYSAMMRTTCGEQNPPWQRPMPGRTRFFTPSTVGTHTFERQRAEDLAAADLLAAADDDAVVGVFRDVGSARGVVHLPQDGDARAVGVKVRIDGHGALAREDAHGHVRHVLRDGGRRRRSRGTGCPRRG